MLHPCGAPGSHKKHTLITTSKIYKNKYLASGVEYHDVVVGQVGLAEVAALLAHAEVSLVVAAPEQPGQLREPRFLVVRPLTNGFSPQTHPEEVFRLLALVYYLLKKKQASMSNSFLLCNVFKENIQLATLLFF